MKTAVRTTLSNLWGLVKRNPVRAQALIVAGIAGATAFGLGWNGVQVGAVTGFTAAFLAFVTETAVTPLADPALPAGTSVTVITPEGQANRQETVG